MYLKFGFSFLSAFLFSLSSWAMDVDLSKSKITWTGSKVVGSSHTGNIKITKAEIETKDQVPSEAKVVIDMTSITNSDLKDKKWNKKLVDHLKSKDFFNVSKFKTATLKVKDIQKASDKFYFLKGELSIMGVTKPVKLKAEVTKEDASMQMIKVAFEFDRTDFGIKYGSGSFFKGLGDKMISDEVKLKVDLYLNKTKNLASN
jgi:polyisoprenoid-binding protein YceI